MDVTTTDLPGADAGVDSTRRPLSLGETVRLFLGFTSPRLLAAQLAVALALRPLFGPLRPVDALIVLAVALYWPLQEWVLHRLVLHARPRTLFGVHIDTQAARAHRKHHRAPRDLSFTVIPGATMSLLVPIHWLFWLGVTRTWASAMTGICALGAAALFYEWVHFLCHAPYRPRSRYVRRVRAHHSLHHFKNERYWHSFTVPSLDRWLGTGPSPATVPASPTCRDLGVDEPLRQ